MPGFLQKDRTDSLSQIPLTSQFIGTCSSFPGLARILRLGFSFIDFRRRNPLSGQEHKLERSAIVAWRAA
jgi:hypothetical protein